VFFLGQLGKYVPGSVWPVMAQMELGRDHQVPERASGAAVGVFLLVVVGTGLLVTAAVVPLLGADAVGAFWWLLAMLPLALLAISPPVLNRLLGLGLRLARRPPLPSPLSAARLLRAAGWSLAAWLAYGVQIWILAVQLGVGASPQLLVRATGAFAAAWCAGFVLLVAPAGAGVREAALIVLLGGVMARPEATVVAVLSRLLFVVGDLAWGAVALLVGRRRVSRVPLP
jgi:glycosyltransferase 2 family protein